MKKSDFYFSLSPELIAQYPLAQRVSSKLLVYSRQNQQYSHHIFHELPQLLLPNDLLVMNNTRVIPARLYGRKKTGGVIECLVERIVGDNLALLHIKASKAPKPGAEIIFNEQWFCTVLDKTNDLYHCQFNDSIMTILDRIGHIPLPPYIARSDEVLDHSRYQTIYAQSSGSVAAPTAGLHFDAQLIKTLHSHGIQIAYTTLHIGAGTFRPVRTENIHDHIMHSEQYTITESLIQAIAHTRKRKGRVIAVGTTALRSLESAMLQGELCAGTRETTIFIYPGYKFNICDGLITNFHLPESTLLMLVCAFIGHDQAMHLYKEAMQKQYRFFSYGDACLLL